MCRANMQVDDLGVNMFVIEYLNDEEVLCKYHSCAWRVLHS